MSMRSIEIFLLNTISCPFTIVGFILSLFLKYTIGSLVFLGHDTPSFLFT